MSNYKNTIMIVIAAILLVYAAFISIIPAIKTSSFNIKDFEQKCYDATSLITTVDSVQYKIKPNLKTIIIVKNLELRYIDNQPLFYARNIELTSTLGALFGNKFDIKSLYLKNIKYEDQILANGENKLAFLPGAFNSELFGKKSITIIPGDVTVKNFDIKYIGPTTFKEKFIRENTYSKEEVKEFLSQFYFSHVNIK